ncbi:MAG: hypothetical protein ACOCRK_02675 [bacterium]
MKKSELFWNIIIIDVFTYIAYLIFMEFLRKFAPPDYLNYFNDIKSVMDILVLGYLVIYDMQYLKKYSNSD